MLNAAVQQGKPGYPWLVFVHGFSGDSREWRLVGERLSYYPQLHVDLPGHGRSDGVAVSDFAGVHKALRITLNSYNILKYWLIGYSLGGRIAMSWACETADTGLLGLITEGAHPGLSSDAVRQARWHTDSEWAGRFAQQPLEQAFNAWYQQPVFAGMTPGGRRALVALR